MNLKQEIQDPRILRIHPKGFHYDKIKLGGSMLITGHTTLVSFLMGYWTRQLVVLT